MLTRQPHRSSFRGSRRLRQRGVTLLESLVSILILSVGVLGMLGVQLRILVETQTAVHRGQAVRLIEDFAERIKSNPGGFQQLSSYAADWTTEPVAPDCATTPCDAANLAFLDMAVWKQNVKNALPAGQASVFESPDELPGQKRQLGVMVAWRAKERVTKVSDAKYVGMFEIDPVTTGGISCPAQLICHLVYVQP